MGYRFVIHTCNHRRWYVNSFLIPSMLEQGISKDEIIVMVDSRKEGILLSTMKTFDWIGRTQNWEDITWHLQDDILISSSFKKRTDELYGDVICGFCSRYDKSKRYGLVTPEEMWYSFPCIGIKNFVAKECAKWFFEDIIYDTNYGSIIMSGKYADKMFRDYIIQKSKNVRIFNCRPNLAEHIDWMIGGSVVNSARTDDHICSYYWEEQKRVADLREKLSNFFTENNIILTPPNP